jgi:hypothetical protein
MAVAGARRNSGMRLGRNPSCCTALFSCWLFAAICPVGAPAKADGDVNAESNAITVRGHMRSGVECPVLVTPDDVVYSLVGDEGSDIAPGQFVEVVGRNIPVSYCMQGRSISVTSIERIQPPQ